MKHLWKLLLVSLAFTSLQSLAADKLKVLYVGQPQAGPPMVITKALAENLTVDWEFVSRKDCAGALDVIDNNENVLFLMSDVTTMTGHRRDEQCLSKAVNVKDVVGTTASSWHMCKVNGSEHEIGRKRFAVGVASILPVEGFVKDLNENNATKAIGVGYKSSAQVAQALLNGDVEWGMVNPGFSEPLMAEGKLVCPFTFIKQGTEMVGKDKFMAKEFRMTVPELYSAYLININSGDENIRADVNKAITSDKFAEFLQKTRYINTKVGFDKIDVTEVDRFFKYIDTMLVELYEQDGYDWKKEQAKGKK